MSFISTVGILEWIKGSGKWSNKGCQPKQNKTEVIWGCEILNKNTKMWSGELGEKIVKELLIQKGCKVWKPKKINGHQPDFETDDYIYEVKTRNWTTSGTAGEKILGTPYKYADVPELYKKKLKIVLVGYQEYEASKNFDIFNPKSKARQKQIEFWKEMGIEFVRCSDLL